MVIGAGVRDVAEGQQRATESDHADLASAGAVERLVGHVQPVALRMIATTEIRATQARAKANASDQSKSSGVIGRPR